MNGFNENVIKAIIDKKDLTLITETMKIIHPEKPNVYASKYIGEGVRVFKNGDNVHVMIPENVTVVQEVSLAKSLATGDIFDDADDVEHTASYIVNTKLPIRGIMNNGLRKPENLEKMVSVTIGKMNDDGDIDIDEADVENGNNIIDDLLTKDSNEYKSVKGIVDDYLGNKDHDYGYGVDFSKSISSLKDEINSIKDSDISPEDSITDNDWDGDWSIGSNDDNVNEDFASGFSSAVEKLQNSSEVQQEGDDEESLESCCRGNGDCCTTEEDDFSDDLDTSPDGSDDHNPVLAAESFTLKSAEEFFNEFDDGDDVVEETERPYDDYLRLHNYDPKSNTVEIDGRRINAGKQPSSSKERNRMNKFLRENKYNPKDGTIQTTMQNADGSYIRRPFTMNYLPEGFLPGKSRPFASTHNRYDDDIRNEEINFDNRYLYANPQISNRTLNHEVGHGAAQRIQDDIARGVDNAQTRRYLQATKNAEEHLKNHDNRTRFELDDWEHSNPEELYADLYGTQHNQYDKDASPESVERSVRNHLGPDTTRYNNNQKKDQLRDMRKEHNPWIKLNLLNKSIAAKDKLLPDDYYYRALGEQPPRDEEKQRAKEEIAQYDLFKNSPSEWRKKYGNKNRAVLREKELAKMHDDIIEKNKYEGKSRGDFLLNPEYNNVDTSYRQPSEAEYKAAERDMNKRRALDENNERVYAPKKQYSPQRRAEAENNLRSLQDKFDKGRKEDEQLRSTILNMHRDPTRNDGEMDKLINQRKNMVDNLSDLSSKIKSSPDRRILDYTGPNYKPPKNEEESSGPNESINSFNNVVKQKPAKEANQETKAQQEGFLLKKPKKLKPIPIREIVSYITVEITAIQDSNDMAMLSGYTCSKLELVDFYLNCIDTQDDRFIVPHTRQYLVDGQKQLNALLTKILQIKPINKSDRVWRINYPSGYQG